METIFVEKPSETQRIGRVIVDTEKLTEWVDSKIGVIYQTYYEILTEGAGGVGESFITDCVYAGILAKAKAKLKGQLTEIQNIFIETNKIVTFDDFLISMKLLAKSGLKNADEIIESLEEYSNEVGIDFNGFTQFMATTPPNILVPALYVGFYTGFLFASEYPDEILLKKYFNPMEAER